MSRLHLFTSLDLFELKGDSANHNIVLTDVVSSDYFRLIDVVDFQDKDSILRTIDGHLLSKYSKDKFFFFSDISQKTLGKSIYVEIVFNSYLVVKYITSNDIKDITLYTEEVVYSDFLKKYCDGESISLTVSLENKKSIMKYYVSLARRNFFFSTLYYLFVFSYKKLFFILNGVSHNKFKYESLLFSYFPNHYRKDNKIINRYLEDIQELYEEKNFGFVYWTTSKLSRHDYLNFNHNNSLYAERYFSILDYCCLACKSFKNYLASLSSFNNISNIEYNNIDYSPIIRYFLIKNASTSNAKDIAYRVMLNNIFEDNNVSRVDYLMEFIGWEYVLLSLKKEFSFNVNAIAHIPYMRSLKNFVRSPIEINCCSIADRIAVIDKNMSNLLKETGYPNGKIYHLEPNRLMVGNKRFTKEKKHKEICVFTSINSVETMEMLDVVDKLSNEVKIHFLLKLHPHLKLSQNDLSKINSMNFEIVDLEAQELLNKCLYIISPSTSSVSIQAEIFGCITAVFEVGNVREKYYSYNGFKNVDNLKKVLFVDNKKFKKDRFILDYEYSMWKKYVGI